MFKAISDYIGRFLAWHKEHRRKNCEWSQKQVSDYKRLKALEEAEQG